MLPDWPRPLVIPLPSVVTAPPVPCTVLPTSCVRGDAPGMLPPALASCEPTDETILPVPLVAAPPTCDTVATRLPPPELLWQSVAMGVSTLLAVCVTDFTTPVLNAPSSGTLPAETSLPTVDTAPPSVDVIG